MKSEFTTSLLGQDEVSVPILSLNPGVHGEPDDGGHDVIDNFEFLCNSVENLISI